jgi:periplasmic protein TonB
MAREGLRSHLSGSVPISIAFHLGALLLFLIIPLTAEVMLPMPAVSLPDYIRVAPMPPPPVVTLRPARPDAAAAKPDLNPTVAPFEAPPAIQPEVTPPGAEYLGPTTNMFGPPASIGAIVDSSRSIAVQPPEPPRPAGPVRAGDLPVAPMKTVDARPIYPEIARRARVEGIVVMEAVLDTSGRVTQLRVVKSVPLLDQAALDAVRQWRYTPSVYAGHPVSVLMTVTIRFMLQQ